MENFKKKKFNWTFFFFAATTHTRAAVEVMGLLHWDAKNEWLPMRCRRRGDDRWRFILASYIRR
jgi:hypothetical protein